MLIQGKPVMYDLLAKGQFGNILRIWKSIEELEYSHLEGYSGNVSVRTATVTAGRIRPFYPNQRIDEGLRIGHSLRSLGYHVYFNECPPDHLIIMNAEYTLLDGIPYMEYSTVKTSMRDGFRRQRLYGVSAGATLILRKVLSPASFEDITAVAEQFPNAVVEFSAYDVFVGCMKGRNAVVWECRHHYL